MRGPAFALRRRRYTPTAQDVADRLIRDLMSQIGESPDDPIIAPRPIFLGHSDDQSLDFSLSIRGRPGTRRARDRSNLRAMLPRCHARIVSGRATVATSLSASRPVESQSHRASLARRLSAASTGSTGPQPVRATLPPENLPVLRWFAFLTVRAHFSVMVNEPFQSDGKPVFLSVVIRAANNAWQ